VIDAPAAAFLLLTLEGAAVIVGDVVSTTTLQRVVPRDRIGSVFGILGSLTVVGIALGSLVAPFTIEWFGLRLATAIAGGFLIVVTIATLPWARAIDRVAAARAAELAPIVELLERIGILELASRTQLEALAANASREAVAAGTVVIREGDEPDDLFVIDTGGLEVSSAEVAGVIATLGAGEVVGEIGLIEKRPRTATVTAVADSSLYRIPGEDFLRILNEGPRVSTTLLSVIANRLAVTAPVEELGHA
jgi:MFS family permease